VTHFAIIAWLIGPAAAAAQAVAAPTLARWDVTVLAGPHLAHALVPEDELVFGDQWIITAEAAAAIGRYWSPHLKTELAISAGGEGRQLTYQYISLPGSLQSVPYATEHFRSQRQVSAIVAWQFFENQWVHPFIEGGVVVDRSRVRTYVAAQRFYTGDPRSPGTREIVIDERREGPTTTTTGRGLIGAGGKMYVTERLFFRADTRAVLSPGLAHLSFRGGLGVDF
jgi:hypothetical protein